MRVHLLSGLATAATNPMTSAYFLMAVAAAATPARDFAAHALGGVGVLAFLWYVMMALIFSALGARLAMTRATQAIRRIAGLTLIAFALRSLWALGPTF